MSPEYKKAMEEGKPITLYLFVCSSATGEENSLAARFSDAFKNVTVVGSDQKLNFANYNNGIYGISSADNDGNLVTYKDRKKINTQRFHDFKKTQNPTVKPTKLK